jgi:hypothetical protein
VLQSRVNDSRLNRRFLELLEEVITTIVGSDRSDDKIKVGSIKSELMVVLRLNFEVFTNIISNPRSCRCREAKDTLDFELVGKMS